MPVAKFAEQEYILEEASYTAVTFGFGDGPGPDGKGLARTGDTIRVENVEGLPDGKYLITGIQTVRFARSVQYAGEPDKYAVLNGVFYLLADVQGVIIPFKMKDGEFFRKKDKSDGA